MSSRHYGQYCGLARAAELIGERWALLVLRDLLLRPKRFTDLKLGLPKIPSNILSARLKELEASGIIQRTLLPRPTGVVYELTPYGRKLEPVLHALGGWGLESLGEPREDDIINLDSLTMALHGAFQPRLAKGLDVTFELRVGESVVHGSVSRGKLELDQGPAGNPELAIQSSLRLRHLFSREIEPELALKRGEVKVRGSRATFKRWVNAFTFPPARRVSLAPSAGPDVPE